MTVWRSGLMSSNTLRMSGSNPMSSIRSASSRTCHGKNSISTLCNRIAGSSILGTSEFAYIIIKSPPNKASFICTFPALSVNNKVLSFVKTVFGYLVYLLSVEIQEDIPKDSVQQQNTATQSFSSVGVYLFGHHPFWSCVTPSRPVRAEWVDLHKIKRPLTTSVAYSVREMFSTACYGMAHNGRSDWIQAKTARQ